MLTIACATDDGKHLLDRYFGEARYYAIYEVDNEGFHYQTTIENTASDGYDDDVHGDAVKAKHVMMLLSSSGVQAALSRFFGPNVNRIKIRFLSISTTGKTIEDGLQDVVANIAKVTDELNKGPDKKHLTLS